MVELVIDDRLDTPLSCSACGRPWIRCSLPAEPGGVCCKFCGAVNAFADPGIPPPRDVTVSESRDAWRIGISTRSPRAAAATLGAAIGSVAVAFEHLHRLLTLFGNGLPLVLALAAACAAIAVLYTAAYWIWGEHSISAVGPDAIVFKGLGPIGMRRYFDISAVNGVCLKRCAVENLHDDRVVSAVRLESVGSYLDFAAKLPEEQRLFIAWFLLRKRMQYAAASATATMEA